jgi:uncharacterized protein (DUF433 family)
MTTKRILKECPELEEEDITQALRYATWISSEKAKPISLRGVADA